MSDSGSKTILLKTCEVMQYWEYMDCNEIAVVISRIIQLSNLKSYCIITHDKDILPSGEPKKAHFHAVLTFSNAKTVNSIANAIRVEPQYVNKIKTTTKSAQLYLVHRNNPEKYQYDPAEVKANFDYVNFADDCPVKEKRENIAQRIESGEIKPYNLYQFITIDEYGRNKQYYTRCFEYRQSKLRGVDRKMECIFITGGSGTGKTTYAKMISSERGYHSYVSSGGKNPLDNYEGQECIILDDIRSSTFSLSDFLKLTDNNTDSLVGCRYYNKSIAECKLLIVTSVVGIDEFYANVINENHEPKVQLLRRFSMLVVLDPEYMYLHSYNPKEQRYVRVLRSKNPISLMFNPKSSRSFIDDFVKAMGLEVLEEYPVQSDPLPLPGGDTAPF